MKKCGGCQRRQEKIDRTIVRVKRRVLRFVKREERKDGNR